MKSELFVINSVMASERAFSAVAEYVPSTDVTGVLKVLQNVHKLKQVALDMRVEYSEVFGHLEKAIIAAFNRRIVAQLTRAHMQMLLSADAQRTLSQALGCSPKDTLQTLFSIPHLQDTLDYVEGGTISQLSANSAQLIKELLRPDRAQKLEFDYTTTQNDWERIVVGENWLVPESAKLLLSLDRLSNTSTPVQVLAELVDQSSKHDDTAMIDQYAHNSIGALGLLELRRRLFLIIDRMQEQALEYAEYAANSLPASPAIQLLLPLLHLYELGFIAKGVKAYIKSTHALENLLPNTNRVEINVSPDSVMPNHRLIFSGEGLYMVASKEVGTLEIRCALHNQREPQLILRASEVPAWVYNQLERDIPKLTIENLSLQGMSLSQRLLNTSFPILEPEIRLLQIAVEELGDRFVQAVALACESPIEQIPEIWRKSISHRLPYSDLPAQADPLYSFGVEQIVLRHQHDYGQQLKQVQGFLTSDLKTANDPG